MPWAAKKVVARRRNAAAVTAFSSGRDWREREAGVGIDRGVPVPVADPFPAGRLVLGAAAAVDPPTPAGGDRADLLHVYLPAELMAEVADHYRRAGARPRTDRLSTLARQDRTTSDAVVALARAAAAGAADLYGQAGTLWLATHLLVPDPRSSATTRDRRVPGPLLQRRLHAVLDLMESHHADDLTLERLAAEAAISKFHFVRLFRQATGTTPHAHLVRVRLAAAHTLLMETDLSVGQVSARCGFPRANHFSTAFKTRFGASPTELRARPGPARPGGGR